MTKTAVILGYGLGVGEAILERFAESGYIVAIVARNKDRLDTVSKKYGERGLTVKGYGFDLSKSKEVAGLITKINADLGGINVVVYNATIGSVDYSAPIEDFENAVAINITSLHAAFNAVLPIWKAAGGGTFLLSGGGFSQNGAWSVPIGFQVGAAAKSYFINFAQSANATFSGDNIHVCCVTICSYVYGGDAVTLPDPNPEESNKFRVKMGSIYVEQAEAGKEDWKDNVILSP